MSKKLINEKWINLACGQNRVDHINSTTQQKDGVFFGVDIVKTDAVDAVIDLEQFPWDIESESAEELVCSHYVEHTPMETYGKRVLRAIKDSKNFEHLKMLIDQIDESLPSDGLILFMDECYRILKNEVIDPNGDKHGGRMRIIAPYYSSARCWQDPTHRRPIMEWTFMYFNKGWREQNRLDHYGIKSDFDFVYGYDLDQDIINRNDEYKTFAMRHYVNTVNDVIVTLTKRPAV